MKLETIEAIVGLAVSAYNKKSKPGEFARTAAHKAAMDAAHAHNPHLADFATLNAAATFYVEITEAINFTSQVTDKAVSLVGAHNNYQALWENYASTILPKKISADYFEQLAQAPDKISKAFIDNVAPTYDTTSVLDVVARNKAKRAALYVYLDTYAVCRAAFIRALFIANRSASAEQLNKFQQVIRKRLVTDLTYDIIHPFFIFKLLNYLAFKVTIAIILLIAIASIFVAAFNLTTIPFIPLIGAGSGASIISAGLLVGSFFAGKRCAQLENENNNRAENAQVI